jgi:hypothetical protein
MAEGRYDTGRMPFAAPVARLKIKKQKYEGITFAVAEMVQTIDL